MGVLNMRPSSKVCVSAFWLLVNYKRKSICLYTKVRVETDSYESLGLLLFFHSFLNKSRHIHISL